jgi:septal ring factor EnvC (AmiA/AmiB activator)
MLRTALCLSTLLAFAAASTALAADAPEPVAQADRKCDTVQRRVAKEEKSLAAAEEEIERDKQGQKSCATKGACERFAAAIKSMEARKARHETRLVKLRADVAEVCKPS